MSIQLRENDQNYLLKRMLIIMIIMTLMHKDFVYGLSDV